MLLGDGSMCGVLFAVLLMLARIDKQILAVFAWRLLSGFCHLG